MIYCIPCPKGEAIWASVIVQHSFLLHILYSKVGWQYMNCVRVTCIQLDIMWYKINGSSKEKVTVTLMPKHHANKGHGCKSAVTEELGTILRCGSVSCSNCCTIRK